MTETGRETETGIGIGLENESGGTGSETNGTTVPRPERTAATPGTRATPHDTEDTRNEPLVCYFNNDPQRAACQHAQTPSYTCMNAFYYTVCSDR